jgi:Tol biopolymer transport system component
MSSLARFYLRIVAGMAILCMILAGVVVVIGKGVRAGSSLVFMTREEALTQFYVTDVNRSLRHRWMLIEADISGYCLSPDGSKLLYSTLDDYSSAFSIHLKSTSSLQSQLLDAPHSYPYPVTCSPNSPYAIYETLQVASARTQQLHIVNPNSGYTQPFPISFTPQQPIVVSPDGTKVALTATTEEVYIYDIEANALSPYLRDGRPHIFQSWSPDSQSIIQISDGDIFITELETGASRQLTNSEAAENDVVWSPDGESIVFAVQDGSLVDIVISNLAATERRIVIQDFVQDRRPAWSPDSSLIAFDAPSGTILVVDVENGSIRNVAPGLEDAESPVWLP